MSPIRHHRHAGGATRTRRERGASLVVMTLSMASLLVVSTLVIDGSQAYPQRRKAQNAVDEASLAATRALDRYRIAEEEGMTAGDVVEAARSVVEENGVDLEACTVVDGRGDPLGPCTSSAVDDPEAVGVDVEGSESRPTSFGRIVDREEVTARATSAATSQPLVGTASPFVVCGNPARGGYPILDPDGTVNVETATAMGKVEIQSSKVPTCGAGSAFKGKIEDADEIDLPGWVEADNGNGFEHEIQNQVLGANACPTGGPFTDCDMLIPIADEGRGNGTKIVMHAVAWAVFHIVGDGYGNPKYEGYFRSDVPYVSGGETSDGVPTAATPRVIRLIE